MLRIIESGKIYHPKTGETTLENVSEKELLLVIAAKLHSIRGMMMFFTVITVVALIISVVALILSSAR